MSPECADEDLLSKSIAVKDSKGRITVASVKLV